MKMMIAALFGFGLIGCASGPVFQENAETIRVRPGTTFTISLAGSTTCVAPEYRFERLDPEVAGDAVRFVRREKGEPTPGRCGDHGRDHFVFEAVKPGTVEIRFTKEFTQSDSHREADKTFRVEVGS